MSESSRRDAAFAAKILWRKHNTLSDEDCKTIEECTDPRELAEAIIKRGPPYSIHDVKFLIKVAGEMNKVRSFERDGHRWTDDTLSKYADHVQNYRYTYNDEALKVDPSIDTQQEHLGPMAQDLEKVNPAVVTEDPKSGYKTVDTGRLALMNAGAIADLAREIKELKHGR